MRVALLSEPEKVIFNDFHIHVLTSVIKTFFREMSDPLLTFDLYDEFIRASGALGHDNFVAGRKLLMII